MFAAHPFLCTLGIVILLVLIITVVGYLIGFQSPRGWQLDPYKTVPNGKGTVAAPIQESMHKSEALPYEPVEIVSRDGLTLRGKYYHIADGAPLDIFFHGYRGNSLIEFSGRSKVSMGMGHNVLLIDQRAHMSSDGHTICYGIKERYDAESWINYALSRFGDELTINLIGESMGAATVLMASGLDLPDNVKHILADCPYSSPVKVIKNTIKDAHFPPDILFPFARLAALIFGGADLRATTAAEAVQTNKIPILIIHGDADTFVPTVMSEEIYEAAPDHITRVLFPGAAHAGSFWSDPERYTKLMQDFLA